MFTTVMSCLPCIAQQTIENEQVTMLGYEFHNGAFYCSLDLASESDLKSRKILVMEGNNNLTIIQLYAALNFKINGQDVFHRAKLQDCELCDIYAQELEDLNHNLKFIIEDLKKGHLTIEEFHNDDQLSNKLNDFRKKRLLSELSKDMEFASDSIPYHKL